MILVAFIGLLCGGLAVLAYIADGHAAALFRSLREGRDSRRRNQARPWR